MAGNAEREFDLIVLGGGPAGYPAAIRASQLGARVCLVEKEHLGGTCLNCGCIPTKTLHALAHLVERIRAGGELVIGGESIRLDSKAVFENKRRIVGTLVSGVEGLLKGRKVTVYRGVGRVTGPGEIEIEGIGKVKGKNVIIATGAREVELPGMEFDGERILSSTDLLDLGRIPESLLVVGGGVIGCEFASIFNAFGVKVTIVEMLPTLISTEDAKVGKYLGTMMRRKGIDVHLGVKVASIERETDGVTARLENGNEIDTEIVLVSVGRRPNVTDIGLEGMNVHVETPGIAVNTRMETSAAGVYAAGDVVGGLLLAHVATREGIVAAENALGAEREIRYDAIPSTIYTLPEVSSVGMTEDEAREKGVAYSIGRFPFAANGKAMGLGEEEGFVKWLATKDEERLIGLHIIGAQATELLTAGIVAVERGMTVHEFAQSVFPHPTLSESLMEAAEAVRHTAIHTLR